MPETEDQILSLEELREEIRKTKQEIYFILSTLSKESARLAEGLGDLNNGDYIPLMLTSRDTLLSLLKKASLIHAMGTKLDFLNDLKNKKTP